MKARAGRKYQTQDGDETEIRHASILDIKVDNRAPGLDYAGSCGTTLSTITPPQDHDHRSTTSTGINGACVQHTNPGIGADITTH
jgi:hypothetical protein